MHEKIKKLEELKDKLIDGVCAQADRGIEYMDTQEAGAVIDMIKDLAEACEKYWKGCYYEIQVAEYMEEYPEGRMGYDRYRFSNGRFAPKGRGHISGYMPPMPQEWMMLDDDYQERMGYSSGGGRGGSGGSSGGSGGSSGGGSQGGRGGSGGSSGGGSQGGSNSSGYSESGRSYDRYQDSRRHYTETNSPMHKQEMSMHAQKHLDETVESIRDIWKDSDPELRQRMRNDISRLMNEMNV